MSKPTRVPAVVAHCLGIILLSLTADAQWNDKVTNTPSIIQTDFGPYGQQLPGDGLEYCGPTSATMLFFWLADNGYTQLAPSTYTEEAALNIDRILGGLMGTSAAGGTDGTGINEGMATYLNARGIGSRYVMDSNDTPDALWMDMHNQNQSILMFSVAWGYDSKSQPDEYTFSGGHVLPLLSVDLVAGTVTVNNAWPYSFFGVGTPNVPSSNPQIVTVESVPANWILDGFNGPSSDYSQIVTPVLGPGTGSIALLQSASSWTLDENARPDIAGYSPETWTIDGNKELDTNGGTLEVLAPLSGVGGIIKKGQGELILTATNNLTGNHEVWQGVLASSQNTGAPFGTGSITLKNDSILRFSPDDSAPGAVSLAATSGSENIIQIDGGASALVATKGANTSLTIMLGGNTDGTTPNLTRNGSGTLILKPDAGLSSLGASIRILLNGSGGNLPPTANGMVAPWLLGVDNDSDESAAFLTYDPIIGYVPASTVSSNALDINSATDTTIYRMVGGQSVSAGGTASVKALEIDGSTLASAGGITTLHVGTSGQPDAGVILNGGTIATSIVDFGDREALIYTSKANGSIESVITGSGDFVKSGKGTLSVTAANQNSGTVYVKGGTLRAANSTGSATGSGAIVVGGGATLLVDGPDGTVGGNVTVNAYGILRLQEGTVGGTLAIDPMGIIQGSGTLAASSTINGSILGNETGNAGKFTFADSATLTSMASFTWRLSQLTDVENLAGSAWNQMVFLGDAHLGDGQDMPLNLYVDFAEGIGPESPVAKAFWSESHEWLAIDFQGIYDFNTSVANDVFETGFFDTRWDQNLNRVYITYSPVPEPSCAGLILAGFTLVFLKRRPVLRRR